MNRDLFIDEKKHDIVQFFFDKIICKNGNSDHIESAFLQLKLFKVTYKARKQNFNDVYQAASNESENSSRKIAIADGLQSYKPSGSKEQFWNEVDVL